MLAFIDLYQVLLCCNAENALQVHDDAREPAMSKTTITVMESLRNLPLFNGVNSSIMERIANGSNEIHAPRGTTVCRRGQPALGFHIVVSGQVKRSLRSSNGDERIMEVVGAGQTFGEAAMFLEKPYLSDAETIVDSRLLHIGRNTLLAETRSDPEFSQTVLMNMSARLYRHVENLEICMLSSGVRRVIRYLLNNDSEDRYDGALHITLPTKKWIIASSLNLTQEHFSRILHALVREDLIKMDGRQVRIPDASRLRSYASD